VIPDFVSCKTGRVSDHATTEFVDAPAVIKSSISIFAPIFVLEFEYIISNSSIRTNAMMMASNVEKNIWTQGRRNNMRLEKTT
jgi:hypothetical protein